MKPSGTPTLMTDHEECLPFKTILCILFLRKSVQRVKKFTVKPYCHSLQISSLCQPLSKALEMSKNIALVSIPSSKHKKIS